MQAEMPVSSHPMPEQVFAGSNDALRFLVNHGYTDVNAPAAYSGLTPLMCVVLCRTGADRVSNRRYHAQTP